MFPRSGGVLWLFLRVTRAVATERCCCGSKGCVELACERHVVQKHWNVECWLNLWSNTVEILESVVDQVVFFFGTIEPYGLRNRERRKRGRDFAFAGISLRPCWFRLPFSFGFNIPDYTGGKNTSKTSWARASKKKRGLLAALRANGTRSSSPWSARKSCGVMFGEGWPPGTATLDQAPPQMKKNGRFSKIIWIPTMLTFRNWEFSEFQSILMVKFRWFFIKISSKNDEYENKAANICEYCKKHNEPSFFQTNFGG